MEGEGNERERERERRGRERRGRERREREDRERDRVGESVCIGYIEIQLKKPCISANLFIKSLIF